MAKKKFSYKQSLNQLESILEQLNSGDIDIDQLQAKVKKAREILDLCKNRLRETQEEIDELLD